MMKLRSFRLRAVDAAFAVLALVCLVAIPLIIPTIGKAMIGCWAAACVAGIVFRWGWCLPTTLGTFLVIVTFQPFLSGYSHRHEEEVLHMLIIPTVSAALVAALQIGFAWAEAANRIEPRGDDHTSSNHPAAI